MKAIHLAIATFLILGTSCSSGNTMHEGGLYSYQNSKGKYQIIKILKVEDQGVHVRMYSNSFDAPPSHIEESSLYMSGMNKKPGEALGMGHIPVSTDSFRSWKISFIQQSKVTAEELDGYNLWHEAGGGYF